MRRWTYRMGWRAAGSIWLVLAACSTGSRAVLPDGPWRYARIAAIGDDIRPRATPAVDCRRSAGADPHRSYAAVVYLDRYHLRHRIVALPPGSFETGERVYVNVEDCAVVATLALGSKVNRTP